MLTTEADGGALLAKLRAEIETLTASIAKFKLEIKGMQPLVDEHVSHYLSSLSTTE